MYLASTPTAGSAQVTEVALILTHTDEDAAFASYIGTVCTNPAYNCTWYLTRLFDDFTTVPVAGNQYSITAGTQGAACLDNIDENEIWIDNNGLPPGITPFVYDDICDGGPLFAGELLYDHVIEEVESAAARSGASNVVYLGYPPLNHYPYSGWNGKSWTNGELAGDAVVTDGDGNSLLAKELYQDLQQSHLVMYPQQLNDDYVASSYPGGAPFWDPFAEEWKTAPTEDFETRLINYVDRYPDGVESKPAEYNGACVCPAGVVCPLGGSE